MYLVFVVVQAAILVGGVIFRDFKYMPWARCIYFMLGVCLCLLSVILINIGRAPPDDGIITSSLPHMLAILVLSHHFALCLNRRFASNL